jgi:hypothetical protein
MVADCKSAGLTPYVGSNPTPTIGGRTDGRSERRTGKRIGNSSPAGVAQLVEHQPSKLRVAGSSPVARFEENGEGGEDGQGGEGYRRTAVPPGM